MALHRLLERQHYRLAYWRVASDEINYRRFFEIADLAGIRVEDRTVFEATHSLHLPTGAARLDRRAAHRSSRWPRQIRAKYLERPERELRAAVDRGREDPRRLRAAARGLADPRQHRLPLVNVLSGVYIDKHAEAHFDRVYQRFTGERASFEEIAIASRHLT